MLDRRSFLTAVLAVSASVSARPLLAGPAPDAGTFILGLAESAMNTVAIKDLSDAERSNRFRTLFVDTFDLPEISRFVLGRYWRSATEVQRTEFQKLFEDIQVYTWTRRFKEYNGETLELGAVKAEGEDFIVDSQMKRAKLAPINVSWRVRRSGESFHILDIIVEGASMAITFRSDYSAVLSSQGGKMDGLLDVMRKKAEQIKLG
ncbi:MAG: ABC transporter substrate-binding protein [Magnetospirillum gryphiswaldense]|nr:ABC transporter substrate-binding protein [Magnetospirillum gryphiswaldense]